MTKQWILVLALVLGCSDSPEWHVCYRWSEGVACYGTTYSDRGTALAVAAEAQAASAGLTYFVSCDDLTIARQPTPTLTGEQRTRAWRMVEMDSDAECRPEVPHPEWWRRFWGWVFGEAEAAECPEGCVAMTPTRTATMPTATRTRTSTWTARPTRTSTPLPTLTRTRVPSATRTSILVGGGETAPEVRGWNQMGGNPGRTSYRPDVALDPTRLQLRAHWTAPRGHALGRAMLVDHGGRLLILLREGEAGFYDSPWRGPGEDHKPSYLTHVLDLDGQELASSSTATSWVATYEGWSEAWWRHPTLKGYTMAWFVDGGLTGMALWGTPLHLTISAKGRYEEAVGPTACSEKMGWCCYQNQRSWHGGSNARVVCVKFDGSLTSTKWAGANWYVGQPEQDELRDGGIAISEGVGMVVASQNFTLPSRLAHLGMYAWPVSGTGPAPVSVQGGAWSAPAVDGRYAYATREWVDLVELDLLTGAIRERPTATGVTNAEWNAPPVLTRDHVILVEPALDAYADGRPHGDLVAYNRSDLSMAWRYDARILSHVDPLSGWSRTEDHYVACDRTYCYVAGQDGLFALRESDGTMAYWIAQSGDAPEGFYGVEVAGDTLLAANTTRYRSFPICQATMTADGKPVGAVDYGRCGRGTNVRCPNSRTAAECSQEDGGVGWDDDERYRMTYPSDGLWVWRMP